MQKAINHWLGVKIINAVELVFDELVSNLNGYILDSFQAKSLWQFSE